MATFKEALEYAAKNPNSDFAQQFGKEVSTGKHDEEAKQFGIDTTPIKQKFSNIYSEQTSTQNRLQETGQDIKQIGTGIISSAQKRAENIQETRQAFQSGEQGAVRSTLQIAGQLLGAGSDAIGEVFKGAVKVALSQKGEEKLKEVAQNLGTKVADTNIAKNAVSWYENLPEANKRDVDAAGGVISLVADLTGAGGATKKIVSPTVGFTKGALTQAKETIAPVGRLISKAPSEISGTLTGTSGETIREAFNAAYKGGKDLDALTKNLRSQQTSESLVNNIRNSVNTVQTNNTNQFSSMLENVGNNIVSTKGIKGSVESELKNLGVNVKNGILDFSNSKFRTVPEAQRKLSTMYEEIKRFGDTATINEIDTSRQALGSLLLTGEDASAKTANKAITTSIDKVRSAGMKVEEYKTALNQFAENADFLDEISKSLSVGDKSTIDSAYKKIITTLKTNNEQRLKLIRELDTATDGSLLSSIAGQQLSEELPRGLFRQISAGIVGAGVVTGGTTTAILPALVFASPRLTGEFVRALGIGASKTNQMIKAINSVRTTLSKMYNIPEDTLYKLLTIGAVETANK